MRAATTIPWSLIIVYLDIFRGDGLPVQRSAPSAQFKELWAAASPSWLGPWATDGGRREDPKILEIFEGRLIQVREKKAKRRVST
ncbi:hypothetical protein DFP72DRAFT_519320 [Ephemerocybe angulata]|uniref:Uncharacterized protein n=1 Tax=Ephemerocybe angulata TaxID=980116 RepID=A0A8H6ICJ6_9AGAR|nr:hypothetical protein DFP72DRAFT_519320 [Tulosesus angulatus]